MRLMERMRLRIKDVDFDRQVIIVRDAKGGKDRVVMLPRTLVPALRLQLLAARALWKADRQAQRGGVETPHALEQKYPKVGYSWAWFWIFPSLTFSIDPRSGVERRHHLYEDRVQRALKRRYRWPALSNRCPFTRFATLLPRICCSRAPTSEPCRNCWATQTCPPP